jgi:exoribonuclease R
MMVACTAVLRGAGYVAFNGSVPEQPMHWALASEYAHATAPLRRLVDRYVGEVCVAICAGQPVPAWALAALPGLPATMQASGRLASRYERAVVDLVEAITLAPRLGEVFDGTIVDTLPTNPQQGVVMIREPAIEAAVGAATPLPLGDRVRVKLVEADASKRSTRFELVG